MNESIAVVIGATGLIGNSLVKQLLNAHDPDTVQNIESGVRSRMLNEAPVKIDAAIEKEKQKLIEEAVSVFHNPDLRNYIVDVRKKYDQVIDSINIDEVTNIGWVKDQKAAADQHGAVAINAAHLTAIMVKPFDPDQLVATINKVAP
jgi:type I restriction enzyme R subunit